MSQLEKSQSKQTSPAAEPTVAMKGSLGPDDARFRRNESEDTVRVDIPLGAAKTTISTELEQTDMQTSGKNNGYIIGGLIVVGAIIAGLAIAASQIQKSPDTSDAIAMTDGDVAGAKKTVPVVLVPARNMTFESRITVAGDVRADRYALVAARIPGTLDKVFVDEGDTVVAGKTQLFQTDSVKLIKAVAIARQNLAVSNASVREKEAMLEKDLASLEQAQNDLRRYQTLLERDAIAAQAAEQQASVCKEREADVKHTKALIELCKAQLEQARLNVTIAEKDLADSRVLAPISGRVSQRLREPGEMAGAGTPVVRIEDPSVLEVSVFLPEEFYPYVVPGKTKMRVRIAGGDLDPYEVSYKSPTVNNKLRTFEVKCLINSPPPGVVPGCLAKVTLVTDSGSGVGIPAEAVQTRDGGPVVFTVVDGKAKRNSVKTGRELNGWREITQGLEPDAPVISKGQFLVEDGTPISVVGGNGQ